MRNVFLVVGVVCSVLLAGCGKTSDPVSVLAIDGYALSYQGGVALREVYGLFDEGIVAVYEEVEEEGIKV